MIRRITFTLSLGLGLALGLLWLLGNQNSVALADAGILYVAPGGDCGGATPCYATVQAAVDAASAGDVIKVAQGIYTGVQNVPSLNTGVFTATQVVVITKTITIRGGYTTSNWTTPDSAAHPTILDAQGQGRVLYITGDISLAVEGLHITGGDATGLGGGPGVYDAGGGVYVYGATTDISNCVVISNTASTASYGYGGGLYLNSSAGTLGGNTVQGNTASTAGRGDGGGLYLAGSAATLSGNTVVSNTASTASYGQGGGLCLVGSPATLSDNTVQDNTGSTADYGSGGGLHLYNSDATLSGNTVQGNTASTASYGYGGGLYLYNSAATLNGNTVQGNTVSTAYDGGGGGLYLVRSAAMLSGNTVVSNTATLNPTATGQGGGLWVGYSSPFTLINNLVADNHANTQGSGLWFEGADTAPTSGRLLHTTVADNRGSGQGVFVGEYTTLAFTNTIITGHHSVGITVTTGSTVTLEATLWYNNGAGTGGTVISIDDVVGDPSFVNPFAWDYHLAAGSAAIDAGVDAGVTTDIDGDTRPWGEGYDISADEYKLWRVYLPIVVKEYD